MQNTFLDSLSDPAVRDLAWVIGSPGLLDANYPAYNHQVVDDAWCSAQLHSSAAWLRMLDLSPLPLHEFIAAHPTRRLGRYFETLIIFWLQHMPGSQIIATNLQVQHGQRTLGEYDVLFRDASAAVCHWEAAVKFYLQQEPRPEQRTLIGPGTKDRLDLKLHKVFQHQLLLGNTSSGRQALPAGLLPDKAQAFIKGYLFYHAASTSLLPVPGVSTAHLSGWWVRHNCEPLPQASAESRWVMQPRLRWLAPARLRENAEVMNYALLSSRLNQHFNQSREALLLFEMVRMNTGVWQEISRGFIVCASWPDMDAAYPGLTHT